MNVMSTHWGATGPGTGAGAGAGTGAGSGTALPAHIHVQMHVLSAPMLAPGYAVTNMAPDYICTCFVVKESYRSMEMYPELVRVQGLVLGQVLALALVQGLALVRARVPGLESKLRAKKSVR